MKKQMAQRTTEAGNEEKKFDFAAADFFVMRAPLLPFGEFLQWGRDLQSGAPAMERARLRERLQTLVAQPALRDALFTASPDLDSYLEHWLNEPESKRGARVEGALVRYFSRLCGRATPFGLFAATSLGKVGAQTELTVASQARCQRHTRLDMDYLFALTDALGRDAEVRRTLTYRPNSSLYVIADRVRYVEARVNGRARTHHLVAVTNSDCIAATLRRAANGATITELAAALVDDEITFADAARFIEQLIDNQMLVADLGLPITGAEPIHPLIAQLRRFEGQGAAILEQTRDELAALDVAGLGATPEAYRAVAQRLESLPTKVELPRLFQVDMVRPAYEASLGGGVIDEISKGVEALWRIFARPMETELRRFREAFSARYEEREVPLAEALDEDLGIGFPVGAEGGNAPLLRGLIFPARSKWATLWQTQDAFLLRKLSETWATGATEISLSDEDIKALQTPEPWPMPNSFSATCRLAAASAAAIEQGDFQVWVETAGGATGATLFGRFCHADAELHKEVAQYLRAEESFHPDAVFAELAHLPEGRIGNVLARPVLREYEIPYLGHSGAQHEQQLPITDLLVSVRADHIVLRSARLGHEVIPRLTSAHNWARESSTVYRFLGELQIQGVCGGVGWQWGPLGEAPFLPRVTYGRVLLAPAQWTVSEAELKRIGEAAGNERLSVLQQWRAERKLPRMVVLADGDNTLPVDLENALSVDSFAHIVKGRSSARLQELWPQPEQLCARDAQGAQYVHELIVPFLRRRAAQPPALVKPAVKPVAAPVVPRRFAPGSEWLYAKIFCGATTADQVIREVIAPVAEEVSAAGAADEWFFLRYNDPSGHVRVRFHGAPERLRAEVWPRLQAALMPLVEDGRVWRWQLDTYDREVERYGGAAGIELSEQIFFADSVAAAEIIELCDQSDAGADERWRLTLCGIDWMLDDFGFDLGGKATILKTARAQFLAEFKADANLIEQLGERYRQERKRLAALLDRTQNAESGLAAGLEVFARRSLRLRTLAEELRAAEGQLTIPLAEIVTSHLHMHANRVLRSSQRMQELVIYDLLTRLYSSQLAQQQSRPAKVARRAA